MTLQQAIATFGAETKSKLANPSASGAPEDQLRTPLEGLIADLAQLTGIWLRRQLKRAMRAPHRQAPQLRSCCRHGR